MTQSTDLLLSDQPGLGFRAELNSIISAIASSHKGGSAPSYAVAGIVWLDDTSPPWVVKQYDGADWVTIGKLDPSTNKFKMANSADAADLSELPTMKQLQNSSGIYGTTTGSSGVYALDLGTGLRPTAYAAGQEFRVKFNHANAGACTLGLMGSSGTQLGAKDIKMPDGSDPPSGALTVGSQATLRYDGTHFILLGLPAKIKPGAIDSSSSSAGSVLTSDGAGGSSFSPPPSSGIVVTRVVFTSSGTYTKPSDLLYADIEVCGGGGGGGGANSGNSSGTNGSNGGTSSFGAHCSATGGGGGLKGGHLSYGGLYTGGGGGSGVGGDLNIAGGNGGTGDQASYTSLGGMGGASYFGGGARNGSAASAYGSGGGAGGNAGHGGAGGYSRKLVEASLVGATETVAVGSGGAGSTGSTLNGGAGKAGLVIVTEYRTA